MFITYLKSNGSLIIGEKMFKWSGKTFFCYEWDGEEKAWKLVGVEEKPVVKEINGVHKIAIYMKKDYAGEEVGVRVMVYSEYKKQNDYVDYPIMYDDGSIAYDYPERIPGYVKCAVRRLMRDLRAGGVL